MDIRESINTEIIKSKRKDSLMNKFIFALCAVVCCIGFSESYCRGWSAQDQAEQIIHGEREKNSHQSAAKFFGYYMYHEDPDWDGGLTKIFTYDNCDDDDADAAGGLIHTGWYADGYIVTEIGSSNEGFQAVVLEDKVVGLSYPAKREDNDDASLKTVNQYSWGSVETTHDKQTVSGLKSLVK